MLFFGSIGSSSGFVAADLGVALADGKPKPLLVDFFDPLNDLEQPCAATGTPLLSKNNNFLFYYNESEPTFQGPSFGKCKKSGKSKSKRNKKTEIFVKDSTFAKSLVTGGRLWYPVREAKRGGIWKMTQFPRSDFRLHVGWRTIKTAVTAMLVAIVYCLIGRNPAFACIGVIFGLGVDMQDSIKNGGNRLFGTLIGGLLSIVVFWIYLHLVPEGGHTVYLALLLSAAIVVLILLCQYFWPGGVQPGGVVLCIVLFSTPVETYVSYSLNRIFDTAVGVIVALLVNYFLPRERVVAGWERFKGLFRKNA